MATKKLKLSNRVRIGNPAVPNFKVLAQAMNFSQEPSAEIKFLSVAMGVYPGAVVLSWSVKHVGFGEVTYHLSQGKLELDSEGMDEDFIHALHKEVLKRYKQKRLKIHRPKDLVEQMLERFASESQFNSKKKKRNKT